MILKAIKAFLRGDPNMKKRSREWKKSKETIGWNIYSPGTKEPVKTMGTRLYHVHHWLKGKLLRPGAYVVGWFTKKHYKGVPPGKHNQNLQVFERAYEKALHDWCTKTLRTAYDPYSMRKEEYWEEVYREGDSSQILRTAKEATLMIALNDTAYRNFIDHLMYSIYVEMYKEYKGQEVHHLLYTSGDVLDPEYYKLHTCLKTGDRRLYKVTDKTCCQYQAIAQAEQIIAEEAIEAFREQVQQYQDEGHTIAPNSLDVLKQLEEYEKKRFSQPSTSSQSRQGPSSQEEKP